MTNKTLKGPPRCPGAYDHDPKVMGASECPVHGHPKAQFVLALPEQTLLEEIANPKMTRADVVLTYRLALGSSQLIDWRKVNEAIIARWSVSGLTWIKKRAWR